MANERGASGFATVDLENHWSPLFRKDRVEELGFQPVDSITVVHKIKRRQPFKIYLMWKPNAKDVKPPT